ncbi:MAG: hypothetical protein ACN6I3_00120 [bacterium]
MSTLESTKIEFQGMSKLSLNIPGKNTSAVPSLVGTLPSFHAAESSQLP